MPNSPLSRTSANVASVSKTRLAEKTFTNLAGALKRNPGAVRTGARETSKPVEGAAPSAPGGGDGAPPSTAEKRKNRRSSTALRKNKNTVATGVFSV